MTSENRDQPDEATGLAPARRPGRRRATMAAGVAGLAAILGTAAYTITERTMDDRTTTSSEAEHVAPPATDSPAPSRASAGAPAPATAGASTTAAGTSATSATTQTQKHGKDVDRQIKEARASAAAKGVPLQRALQAAPGAIQGRIDEKVVPVDDGTVRVTTARFDLTGHPQMLIAADKGRSVGDGINCTNKVRFSTNGPAMTRPTILTCWRISETRSVVTFTAMRDSTPSATESVNLIEREWKKLA